MPASFIIADYIPLVLRVESSYPLSSQIFYLRYENEYALTQLTLGATFGELYTLKMLYTSTYSIFNTTLRYTNYLYYPMSSYFLFKWTFSPSTGIIPHVAIAGLSYVEIFLNSLVIHLPIAKEGRLLFLQNENFGVITDCELHVAGFAFFNITPAIMKELKALIKETIKEKNDTMTLPRKENFFNTNNHAYVINKIIELKNIKIWNLIRYGYEIKVVNDQFLITLAEELILNKKEMSSVTYEIASVSSNDSQKAGAFLIRNVHIDSFSFEEKEQYNKVWFYLSAAVALNSIGIID